MFHCILTLTHAEKFWLMIIIMFAVATVVGLVFGVAYAMGQDHQAKRTMPEEEYKRWRHVQAKKAIQSKIDYWNAPMDRMDWFLRDLFKH